MRTLKSLLLLFAVVGVVISSCSSNAPVVNQIDTTIATQTELLTTTATFTLVPEPSRRPTITPTNTPILTISKTRINLSPKLYLDENSSPDNLQGESSYPDKDYFENWDGTGFVYHIGNEEWIAAQTWTRLRPSADFDDPPQLGENLDLYYFQVWRDGKILYSAPTDSMWYRPHALWLYEDHWILWFMSDWQNQGRIVQDGILLNDLNNYENAFGLSLLDGKPFFFFKRGDQFGISFNNQEILLPYSNISYGPVCCEGGGAGARNPRSTDIMVGFYAKREDSEYQYIEIGLR